MANQEQVNRLLQGVEAWNQWREESPERKPDLSRVNLSRANLSGADLSDTNLSYAYLSSANLSSADLSASNLFGTNFSAANLSRADLSDSNLIEANFLDADLRRANLSGANLLGADLCRADLRRANLSGADLTHADLRHANLSGAKLIAIQALDADFQTATLTGACIQDWNINSETKLQEVICEYIFIKYDYIKEQYTDRRPHDPNQIFAPGEFTKRYQIVLETVDLFFNDGIDWKAFLASLQELKTQYGDDLNIQGIEKKADSSFVVRLEAPSNADKGAIERQAKELYESNIRLLEARYHAELQAKDKEIESYRRESANMMEITKLLASRPINVEAKAVAESNPEIFTNTFDHSTIGNFANKVQDNARQQTSQHIYASAEKQSLADAAQEIQKLLKILEQTNPTASEAEQKAFVTAATPPTVRQRAVAALQAGGKAAIEEFLDNAYVNVAIAIIEGWRDAGASS